MIARGPEDPLTEHWLSPAQVATILSVSKMTVYRLLDADELFWVRVGRSYRIAKSSLTAWLHQRGNAEGALEGLSDRAVIRVLDHLQVVS